MTADVSDGMSPSHRQHEEEEMQNEDERLIEKVKWVDFFNGLKASAREELDDVYLKPTHTLTHEVEINYSLPDGIRKAARGLAEECLTRCLTVISHRVGFGEDGKAAATADVIDAYNLALAGATALKMSDNVRIYAEPGDKNNPQSVLIAEEFNKACGFVPGGGE